MEHIKETDTDICFLQETFLKRNDTAKLAEIKDYGFNIISVPRKRCGGGIAVVYRDGLSLNHNKRIEKFKTFEVMEVTLQTKDDLLRFINIYRPPYSKKHKFTIPHFLEELEYYFQTLGGKSGTPIIVGDFNIHVEKTKDTYTLKFKDLLIECNLVQLVPHIPTHIDGGTLDLIITIKDIDNLTTPMALKLGTNTDHYLIQAELQQIRLINSKQITKTLNYRRFKDINVKNFRKDLSDAGLNEPSNYDCIDKALKFLETTVLRVMDIHSPLIQKTIRVKENYAPWFDSELKELRRKRRAAERLKNKHSSDENKLSYTQMCQTFNKLVWNKRKEFYEKSLETSRNNARALFNKINRLLGVEKSDLPHQSDHTKLAEDFKDFFVSKISNIRENIESDKFSNQKPILNMCPDHVDGDYVQFASFCQISFDEIKDVIKSMPNKFCSLDILPTWLFKECLPEIMPILHYIINESLTLGVFPQSMKTAILNPTLKSNDLDHDAFKSYRPVSNLSFISKILEKCALLQLTTYLEGNNLISDAQSGYRAYHSCETLLVRMFDDMNREINGNKAVALILLDLSAAFDTIDYDILTQRLQNEYKITSTALDWISSYLHDRSFSVKIDNKFSSTAFLLYGVPQGSLLGPILFILYTKDLKKIAQAHGLSIQLYADDSQLYISLDPVNSINVQENIDRIKACVTEIKQWMVQNFMKLNEEKTQFMLLGKKLVLEKLGDISLDFSGSRIHRSDSCKSLGVKLDHLLTLKEQVNEVKKKCYWTLSNMRCFGHYLSTELKICLVKTLVLSKLDYCNALYVGINVSTIKKLQSVMNNSIRFIYNISDFSINLKPYFLKSHILPIKMRIKYKICLLVHNSLEGHTPQYISDLLKLYCEQPNKHSLRAYLDDRLLLRSEVFYSSSNRKMFSYIAPLMWNELPYDLRHESNTTAFKRDLKTLFFKQFEKQEL